VRAGNNTPSVCTKSDRIVSKANSDMSTIMLTDRYGLLVSTTSSAARDAYVEGCEAKLTMYPGAIEAFDRAIAADPGFALAHAAKAHLLLERGDPAVARTAIAAANSLTAGLSAREASHIAFFDLLAAGEAEAALSALSAHLDLWPRDVLVLATTAYTNGLIGNSGRTGQKRTLLELLDKLAPSYGDDWWFTAHHGMALSENGQRDAARPKIDRSLAQNPTNPWAAHARAHLCYEEGDPDAACAFLASWLPTYPRNGSLYSHLSWHLGLGHLELGDAAAALRLFREVFAPEVHSGPPRGRVNDGVSFLWRWELAGHPRDVGAWRLMHDFATSAIPRAGLAFSDMHIALSQIVAGNHTALAARATEMNDLALKGRYPSGPVVPSVSHAFAAFEHSDSSAAIDALLPIGGELERIGGSRAQLDLVEFTLVKAYAKLGHLDEARAMLSRRRRDSSSLAVAGLAAAD
jgi:tetratricopeptide (TPR) repeat protein